MGPDGISGFIAGGYCLRRLTWCSWRFIVLDGGLIVPRACGLKSLSKILRRVANPVEPLNFMFVQHDLPSPFPDGIRDRLGKQPRLFNQLDDGQANKLQYVHGPLKQFAQLFANCSNRPNIKTDHGLPAVNPFFGQRAASGDALVLRDNEDTPQRKGNCRVESHREDILIRSF
jgi:hypothetical protein